MKKLVALIVCLCMLLTATAFCEADLLQNEMPPMLVKAELDNGTEAVEVLDDGSLVLTDVSARNEAEMARLTAAYEGVMGGVHFSDVPSMLHEDVVKLDINEALKGTEEELTAHDLVMIELFDIAVGEELTEKLVDGAYLEMTLEMPENQAMPMMLLFTPDGAEWRVYEDWNIAGDNTLAVRVTEGGVMAFLKVELSSEDEIVDEDAEVTDPEGVFTPNDNQNPNFTPSVSGKPAPSLKTETGVDGVSYVATIYTKTGEVVANIPDYDYLLVTPVSESQFNADIMTHEHLQWAYDLILNCTNVGELLSADGENTIAAEIDAMLLAMNAELTHEQLVVRDLFEATVYGEYVDHMYNEDHYIAMTFLTDVDPEETLVVLCSEDSVHWYPVPAENVTVNSDGSVTLRTEGLGVFAFLVEAEAELNAEEAVSSPN